MKVKLGALIELQQFCQEVQNQKMPIRLAYKLSKLSSRVAQEEAFYRQKFSSIVSEFAKRDEAGNYVYTPDGASVQIQEGRVGECQTQVQELQDLEIEINDITFTLSELESLDLTVAQINGLLPFITE